MSLKVGVLPPGDSLQPYRHVKRSVAAILVRKALCEYVGTTMIRERKGIEPTLMGASKEERFYRYTGPIPIIKPPREPEGLLLHYPIRDMSSYRESSSVKETKDEQADS